MSMTKSSAAYERWAEQQARDDDNSYQEYLEFRYWQERQREEEEEGWAMMPPRRPLTDEELEDWHQGYLKDQQERERDQRQPTPNDRHTNNQAK